MCPAPNRAGKKAELPKGYELEAAGDTLLLKRPNGFLISAFGVGVKLGSIWRVAGADERYMRAVERQEKFGFAADSETVHLFAEDVREARREFLLALEAAYRGEDVPPETSSVPPTSEPPKTSGAH